MAHPSTKRKERDEHWEKRRQFRENRDQQIEQMLDEGHSIDEIAEAVGVSGRTVMRRRANR